MKVHVVFKEGHQLETKYADTGTFGEFPTQHNSELVQGEDFFFLTIFLTVEITKWKILLEPLRWFWFCAWLLVMLLGFTFSLQGLDLSNYPSLYSLAT